MKSEWLAHYLTRQADPLNQAYRLARQGDAVQFASAFGRFVQQDLDSLLTSLDHWSPSNKAALCETAYQCGLTLTRHGWLRAEQQPVTERLFQQLLPTWLAPYPDAAPRLLTQLLNALSHLPGAGQRTGLLDQWQRCLPAPDATPDALLVFSWMAGLPQYREAALQALHRHPDWLKTLALGDPEAFEHPWWQGSTQGWHSAPVQFGASHWLGGDFTARPRLLIAPGQTLVQAGRECWHLYIDAFGQALLPATSHHPMQLPVPECTGLPTGLARLPQGTETPRQCLERRHDWVVSFHDSYALRVIPKTGEQP